MHCLVAKQRSTESAPLTVCALLHLQADEREQAVPAPAAAAAAPKLQPSVWQHVSDNIYHHRDRKHQSEDDVMICSCKPPAPGQPGCGETCINRMLNLECVAVRVVQLSTGVHSSGAPGLTAPLLRRAGVLPLWGPVLQLDLLQEGVRQAGLCAPLRCSLPALSLVMCGSTVQG